MSHSIDGFNKVYNETKNQYADNYKKSLEKLSGVKNSWFYSLSVDKNGVLVKRFSLAALFDHLGAWTRGENWEQKINLATRQFIKLGGELGEDLIENTANLQKITKQISSLAKQAGIQLAILPQPQNNSEQESDLHSSEFVSESEEFSNRESIEEPLEGTINLDQKNYVNLDLPLVESSKRSIEELYEKAGKFAFYYTANKTPMMNFLKGIGCVLNRAHTFKGDDFLKEEKYEIQIPAINDFYNPNPVTLTISNEKIRAIMSSAKVVVSNQLGIEDYKRIQSTVDDQISQNPPSSLDVRGIVIDGSTLSRPNYSAEMYACQICHSARLPVLTNPYNSSGSAHQQLSDINLDEAPEIVLINTPGANFAYGKGFKETFLDNGSLKVAEFENFLNGLWTNVIFSAIEQNATDLSLLPIGLGAFLKGLSPETNLEIQKSYLRSLKAILEDPNIKPKLEDQFKDGIYFTLGPIAKTTADEIFEDSDFVHFHDRDALNLSQEISADPDHCCAILNPSDGDVMFGIYNVGEYWQTSYKGTLSHVGEEYLMHLIPGQLTGRDMCPEAFENPIVSKLT